MIKHLEYTEKYYNTIQRNWNLFNLISANGNMDVFWVNEEKDTNCKSGNLFLNHEIREENYINLNRIRKDHKEYKLQTSKIKQLIKESKKES